MSGVKDKFDSLIKLVYSHLNDVASIRKWRTLSLRSYFPHYQSDEIWRTLSPKFEGMFGKMPCRFSMRDHPSP